MSEIERVTRHEWERLVRRVRLPGSTKLVALTLSTYASGDGTRVRPGIARLVNVTGLGRRTVIRALDTLRDLQLIVRTFEASRSGGKADEYRLTRPVDLIDRVPMLDANEGQVSEVAPGQVADMAPALADSDDGQVPPETGAGAKSSRAGATSATPQEQKTPTKTNQEENFSPYGAEEEVRPASAENESDLDRDYSEAFKVIQRLGGDIARYVEAVHADAERGGHDPPEGRRLTIAVAALALIDHPDLLKPGRRTA